MRVRGEGEVEGEGGGLPQRADAPERLVPSHRTACSLPHPPLSNSTPSLCVSPARHVLQMPALVKAIRALSRAPANGRWSSFEPVGPLGMHLAIKSEHREEFGCAIERAL